MPPPPRPAPGGSLGSASLTPPWRGARPAAPPSRRGRWGRRRSRRRGAGPDPPRPCPGRVVRVGVADAGARPDAAAPPPAGSLGSASVTPPRPGPDPPRPWRRGVVGSASLTPPRRGPDPPRPAGRVVGVGIGNPRTRSPRRGRSGHRPRRAAGAAFVPCALREDDAGQRRDAAGRRDAHHETAAGRGGRQGYRSSGRTPLAFDASFSASRGRQRHKPGGPAGVKTFRACIHVLVLFLSSHEQRTDPSTPRWSSRPVPIVVRFMPAGRAGASRAAPCGTSRASS